MKVEFHSSFAKDLGKVRDRSLLNRVREKILEIEAAETLERVSGVTAMQGHPGYYRIRMGDYRMGFKKQDEGIRMIRFLKRSEIYRKFP